MDTLQKIQLAANSFYNRGLELAKERDLSGAAGYLKRALELNKYHTDARNLLGLIFYEMGETSDALVQWVISVNLQPEENRASWRSPARPSRSLTRPWSTPRTGATTWRCCS